MLSAVGIFTRVHVLLSLLGIFSGFGVVFGVAAAIRFRNEPGA